ncbi:hypothetical protein Q8A64_18775 [Oxalobacteraceae bacterium R-40]|uniref:Transcriptional regulator n=1 Tax=Keguizhuia sedimenti TaxID=3064264 RepID=A0ABU1BTW9_9BURK|nr:hypothetical protein [Oxalobacteraceae bacterium R-40]
MKISRSLQRALLEQLAIRYPARHNDLFKNGDEERENQVVANLLYLEEHGLIESGLRQGLSGEYMYSGAKITARGIDFLEDDGGLSAILGMVTVRFDDATLKAVIAQRIEQSTLSDPEKKRWIDALRTLPADATKHLTMKLLESGLDHAPGAVTAIGKFLGL